jgi:hypothetical protein
MGEVSNVGFNNMPMFLFCYAILFGGVRASHTMLNALAGDVTREATILTSLIKL